MTKAYALSWKKQYDDNYISSSSKHDDKNSKRILQVLLFSLQGSCCQLKQHDL